MTRTCFTDDNHGMDVPKYLLSDNMLSASYAFQQSMLNNNYTDFPCTIHFWMCVCVCVCVTFFFVNYEALNQEARKMLSA